MNGCSVGMTDNVTDNKPSAQWTLERRTDVANPIAINVALVGVGSGRTVVRRRFAIVGERGFVALSTLLLYKRRVHQIPMRRSPAEFVAVTQRCGLKSGQSPTEAGDCSMIDSHGKDSRSTAIYPC